MGKLWYGIQTDFVRIKSLSHCIDPVDGDISRVIVDVWKAVEYSGMRYYGTLPGGENNGYKVIYMIFE